MAGKVPVGGAIVRAYSFAFGNIVNNLAVIWIPTAILWAANYFLQPTMQSQIQAQHDPSAAFSHLPMLFGLMLIGIVMQSAQMASLTKEALGVRSGSAFLQFPFGAAMWRTLGSLVLLFLVMALLYFAMVLVMVIGGGILFAALSKSIGLAVGIVFLIAMLCGFLYVATRMSFLLPAVAVAEHKVSLIRAWQLTSGNFWRIFWTLFVIVVPFVIVELIVLDMLLAPALHGFHANMSAPELAAFQQQIVMAIQDTPRHYWYVTYPVGLLITLLFYGMYTGAAAFAYNALAYEHSPSEAF
jgi:hypothetical protein